MSKATKQTSVEKKLTQPKPKAIAQTKLRLTKPGGFVLEGIGQLNEGDEITNKVRKCWDDWQAKCGGSVPIEDYTH